MITRAAARQTNDQFWDEGPILGAQAPAVRGCCRCACVWAGSGRSMVDAPSVCARVSRVCPGSPRCLFTVPAPPGVFLSGSPRCLFTSRCLFTGWEPGHARDNHKSLRKGQLNRHTGGTDQPLPHETLTRSGRVTRWTNTPVRIFKDPAPPRPGHATSIGPRPIVHVTGPPCPPKEKRDQLQGHAVRRWRGCAL